MTIDKFNFAGKKAFVRVDFNVPLDENFNITDDTRIRAALPTLKKILADGGSVIIGSHLGRPKGIESSSTGIGGHKGKKENSLHTPDRPIADNPDFE